MMSARVLTLQFFFSVHSKFCALEHEHQFYAVLTIGCNKNVFDFGTRPTLGSRPDRVSFTRVVRTFCYI